MSLEYVDDVHELVVENKRLKEENETLKMQVGEIMKKLDELNWTLDLIRAFNS